MAAQEQVKKLVENALPFLKSMMVKVGPAVKQGSELYTQHSPAAKKYYALASGYIAPEVVVGFVFLLCGGQFALTICAYRAFHMSGGTMMKHALKDLSDSYKTGMKTMNKDKDLIELFDANNDGEVSLDEVGTMLLGCVKATKAEDREKRLRVLSAMMKCLDPNKIIEAVKGFWSGVACVLAVLKSDVARSVTIGSRLGTQAAAVLHEKTAETLEKKYPQYTKWIESGYQSLGAILGIFLACVITRFIMAMNTAIEGGRIVMTWGLELAEKRNMITKDQVKQFGDIAAYGLAVLGFLYQLSNGFSAPWYLALPLTPALICESVLSYAAYT